MSAHILLKRKELKQEQRKTISRTIQTFSNNTNIFGHQDSKKMAEQKNIELLIIHFFKNVQCRHFGVFCAVAFEKISNISLPRVTHHGIQKIY